MEFHICISTAKSTAHRQPGRCWWRTWGQPSMPCVSRQEESKSSRPRPRSAGTMVALRSRSFSTNSATRVSISWLAQWGTWAGKGGRDKKVKVICLQTTYLQGILRFPDVHSLGQNQVLKQWTRIDHYKIVTDDIRSCLLKREILQSSSCGIVVGGTPTDRTLWS